MDKYHVSLLIFIALAFQMGGSKPAFSIPCEQGSEIQQFADFLFSQKEYYRAITEYTRLAFFCGEHTIAHYAKLKIAQSYFLGGRFADSEAVLDSLSRELREDNETAVQFEVLYLRGRVALRSQDYSSAEHYFSTLSKTEDPRVRDIAHIQLAWTFAAANQWHSLAQYLRQKEAERSTIAWSNSYYSALSTHQSLRKKSPLASTTLSLLLPGAGHLYLGRYKDGAVAFLTNLLFGWGLSRALAQGNDSDAIIFGSLTFFFYSGTAFSAYSLASRQNRHVEQQWLADIERRFPLDHWDSVDKLE